MSFTRQSQVVTAAAPAGDLPVVVGIESPAAAHERPGAIVRTGAALLSVQGITWAASFIGILLIPRFLGAQELGLLATLTAVTSITSRLAGMGTAKYVTREVARDPSQARSLATNAIAGRVVISAAFFAFTMLGAVVIGASPAVLTLLVVITSGAVAGGVIEVFYAALQGDQTMGRAAAAGSVLALLGQVSVAVALIMGGGILLFVAISSAAVVLSMAITALVLVTAVICTRNRSDSIAGAVESVLANDHPSFELVIVDQSDSDASLRALGELANDPRLHYIHTDVAGLSRAYNMAVRAGRGSLFAFTDDDCTAPTDWLVSVQREFDEDAEADLLYGQVIAPPELAGQGVVPELRFPRRRRLSSDHGFAVIGMGANFAARRRAFDLVGGFDEILGGGGPLHSSQDYDFQYRLFRCSRVSILSPSVNITHYGLRTDAQWPQTLSAYGIGDGAFYMKHLRCGDLLAGKLLARQVALELRRTISNPVIRHRWRSPAYLVGLVHGMVQSFSFDVDRRRRMYVAR